MHDLDAGIAYQDVDAAIGCVHRIDAGVHRGFVGDVHCHAHGDAVCGFDIGRRFVRCVLVEVGDRHFCAFAREGLRDLQPDAAGGAGDDGDLVIETTHDATPSSVDAGDELRGALSGALALA